MPISEGRVDIRLADDAELESVAQFIDCSFASLGWIYRTAPAAPALISEALQQRSSFITAWWEYRLVAAVQLRVENQMAELLRLAVAPESRRRGIASRLLAHAEQIGLEQGLSRLTTSAIDELGLQSLYLAAGFTVSKRHMVYTGAGVIRPFCAVCYSKSILCRHPRSKDNR